MADNNNEGSTVNTAGAEEAQRKQEKEQKKQQPSAAKEQAKGAAKGIAKKIAKNPQMLQAIAGLIPVLIWVVIIVIIIFIIVGLIGFFTSLPGTFIESIKDFGVDLWSGIVGFFNGDDVTTSVTKEDQIELAQKIQDMGYDITGYGFADAEYEYDNGEVDQNEIDGYTNAKIVDIATFADGRNYLQAYIAQNEATYVLARWNVVGAIKEYGIFAGILEWLLGDKSIPDEKVQAFSEGMINIVGVDKENENQQYLPDEFNEQMQLLGIDISIDRDNKLMKIVSSRAGIASSPFAPKTTFYFDLSDWTSIYGKPLELFLSLHLGTMMPDLSYELATSEAFNTKVNIRLQEVKSTYKVIYRKSDGTELTQEDIERIYLKVMCNMTDEQINRFADAGKLDEAFKTIISKIVDTAPLDYINAQDGSEIYSGSDVSNMQQRRGFNLSEVEEKVLGEKISKVNVTEIFEITNYGPQGEPILTTQKFDTTIDRWLAVVDLDNADEVASAQSALDGTSLSGLSVQQLEDMKTLIDEGGKEANTYLPRIESVTKHWFFKTIEFEYGLAGRAKKKVQYKPTDEDASLSEENLNGGSIILDTTYTNSGGIYYQLAEPEYVGPNDAIIALFKGGEATIDDEQYSFPGEYYRYDGTRRTAQKIANAKAKDEGETTYKFQGATYDVQNTESGDMAINKQIVTFATVDENGNESYTDAFSAFSILENTHSLEAETVYRLFKELVIELGYFTREDFMKPLEQVLLWPVERVGSDTEEGDDNEEEVTNGIYRKDNEYGLFLKNGTAVMSGDTIIAPGDAEVVSVEGNTVRLKFKTISDGNAQALKDKFGDDYFDVEKDIVLDMEMTISGITPSVSAGSSVTAGSQIGTATNEDVRIIMFNVDKSLVEDIETYMYPTYKGTRLGIFETTSEGE